MVFDVSLEMQSDSKNYVGVQNDEITDLVLCIYYKIGTGTKVLDTKNLRLQSHRQLRYLTSCYRKLLAMFV